MFLFIFQRFTQNADGLRNGLQYFLAKANGLHNDPTLTLKTCLRLSCVSLAPLLTLRYQCTYLALRYQDHLYRNALCAFKLRDQAYDH